jgi:hypothetical protein
MPAAWPVQIGVDHDESFLAIGVSSACRAANVMINTTKRQRGCDAVESAQTPGTANGARRPSPVLRAPLMR